MARFVVLALLFYVGGSNAFLSLQPRFSFSHAPKSASTRTMPSMLVGVPKQVLVTGASGRTGFLVFQKLREMEKEFFVKGLVHSEKGAKQLERTGASRGDSEAIKEQNEKLRKMGMPADDEDPEVYMGDILDKGSLGEPMEQCDCLVIVTSGVPKLRKREIVKTVLAKMIGKQRMPNFYYDEMPEEVDWIGCKNQIDVAKEKGVEHIVLVSSMGVTPAKNTPENTLNKIGGGDILVWKAKAEEYLREQGIDWTVIHPGGLLNKPGEHRSELQNCLGLTKQTGGERELVLGVNDELLDTFEDRGATRAIPREDVAELVVQALRYKDLVKNKSFDVVSKAPGDGKVTDDFYKLLSELP